MSDSLTTLYRPVGRPELELIRANKFRAFPPRLAGQPYFYPVLTEEYAVQMHAIGIPMTKRQATKDLC